MNAKIVGQRQRVFSAQVEGDNVIADAALLGDWARCLRSFSQYIPESGTSKGCWVAIYSARVGSIQ